MLAPLTQGGGAEKYFIELARNLRKRGVEADVVTMNEKFFQKFARLLHIFARGNFFGKIDIKGREKESDILRQLGGARWRKTDCKNLGKVLGEYDLIYAKNELADLVLLKARSCKKLPPVVVGVHTPVFYPKTRSFISKFHNYLYSSFFYKWLVKGAQRIHVSSKFAKNIADNKLNIKSELIYYPFSVPKINDSEQKETGGIEFKADKKNIIFLGRLSEQKGIDILADIIDRTSKENDLRDKVRVNIFGSGDKKHEIAVKKLTEKYSFVQYFGHVENKYMLHILAQQDLMVAPSRWETLPYSILEAQAAGVPVVAFDIPGPNDIIENGKTGFLVKTKEDFFEKIGDIIENRTIFDKNEIIQNIENKFDPEKIYSELIKMFRECL